MTRRVPISALDPAERGSTFAGGAFVASIAISRPAANPSSDLETR